MKQTQELTEQTPQPGHAQALRPWMLALLVFALGVGAMGRLCTHEFLDWDDNMTIHGNPRLNPPTVETLKFYWTHGEWGLYIPGTYTVWAGLSVLARTAVEDTRGIRLNPHVFHTANVIFHATAAMVVFALLRRLLRRQDGAGLAACLGAAIFAVHPVQVESVGWISGMKDVLCGLFSVIALWQYVASVQAESPRRRWVHFGLATFAFAWAMLCKPTAMVLPAMAVALDWIVLGRSWRKVLLTTALWWPMALACMVMARMQQTTLGATPPALWLRPLIALDALAFYLKQIVAPITLAIDYGRTPEIVVMKGWLWWTWLIPAAVAALLVWRPRRELIAAAVILVIGVSPVLGFTPFMFQFYSTVSDHYLYLAMLAPALALAWLLTRLPQRGMIAATVGAIVVLGALSVRQAGTWRDNESLYDRAIAVNPDSFLAYNNLASAYAHAGDVAVVAAQVAARVPDVPAAKAYRAQAKQDYHTALALLEKGIATRRNASGKDDYFKAHSNLASIHSILGHNEEALAHRRRAMEILLTYPPQARLELPTGYCLIGQDLLKLGRAAEAAEAYEAALRMEPDNRNAAEGRAKALRALASMQSEVQGD